MGIPQDPKSLIFKKEDTGYRNIQRRTHMVDPFAAMDLIQACR